MMVRLHKNTTMTPAIRRYTELKPTDAPPCPELEVGRHPSALIAVHDVTVIAT